MDIDCKKLRLDNNATSSVGNLNHVRRRIPLRMLGKKFISKRLLVSSKVWMHTIPTQDCDIVLTLPSETQDTTIMWLLARLRSRTPRLLVNFKHHSNSGIYALYITASYESLLEGAEELGIRKPLRSEYGGGMKEFVLEDQECFEGVTEEDRFLTSQERQSIVHHMLNNLRATEGEELERVKFVEGQPIVPRLLSKNIVSGVFPLHCHQDLKVMRKTWVKAIFSKQPLDDVCKYFGTKIGLYFAYLGHYTTWLVAPAVFGIFIWFVQSLGQWWDDVSWVVFSIFNVFWATLFLIHWKRTSSTYSYRWGTLDRKDDLLKDPRPLYKGDLRKSSITGRMEPHYPGWKRNLFRYFVSIPVIALFLGIVFTTTLLIFELQEWVNSHVHEDVMFESYLKFVPKIMLAVAICILDELYKKVAVWINNKENYRLEESYETNLVIKLVLFQFVNSFLSLFYIAFYLRDMDRLREQLAALLITRQVVGNLKEVLLPLIMWKARLYSVGFKIASELSQHTLQRETEKVTQAYKRTITDRLGTYKPQMKNMDDSDSFDDDGKKESERLRARSTMEENALTQVEVENAMTQYDDSFEDYLEMCMQFGYVTLFSSAFPLAALFALLNNIIEIRSDSFKLCYTYQRPFGVRAENSGIWQDVLHVMVLIAVLVNSALIGMGDLVHRLVPNLSNTGTILLIVVVEHCILFLKAMVEYAIPEVPDWIATEMAKIEFQRREAVKRLETQGSSGQGSENRDRSPRTKTPEPQDNTTSVPRLLVTAPGGSSIFKHQSLVGHRPHNFSSNHNEEKVKVSDSPTVGEGVVGKQVSPTDVGIDGDEYTFYRSPWQQDTQIYRRTVTHSSVGQTIVRRGNFGRSRSLDSPSSSGFTTPSSSGRTTPHSSPQQEAVSSQKETTFFPSGATVTYLPGSIGRVVDSELFVQTATPNSSGLLQTSPSVMGTSVDIPREGDVTVDP